MTKIKTALIIFSLHYEPIKQQMKNVLFIKIIAVLNSGLTEIYFIAVESSNIV